MNYRFDDLGSERVDFDGLEEPRRLGEEERSLYEEWIGNRKRLEQLIRGMHSLALQAAAELKNDTSSR